MKDDFSSKKLHKNVTKLTGIAALRKIRLLVDQFEQQGKNDKKKLMIIAILLIALVLLSIYFFSAIERDYQHIQTAHSRALHTIKGVKSVLVKNTAFDHLLVKKQSACA